ncbi:LacI family DNA-binding transcriptional regulator [Nitratireductor sp. GCM10026969]|uniref:LacI family DNA-binding transcriptional regulator n=1 Tax=Nitratireductor sp. GCM10026969 TaxID=3252645 RepID=UPI003609A031
MKGKAAKQATLLDVAQKAGVSRATASLVVRKSPLVSETTRVIVEEAMEELGYVYNLSAARLRAARSRTVGAIVPNLTNPFFSIMLSGMESVLEAAGLVVILANSSEDIHKQAAFIRRMREHAVDGLIICPAKGTTTEQIRNIQDWNLPVVQALRVVADTRTDYSGIDYRGGMAAATRRLIALGHRQIGFVSIEGHHSAEAARLEGFRSALAENGLAPAFIVECETNSQAARALAPALLQLPNPASAIACFNDVIGLGLHRGLVDLGVRIGKEVSLFGFDDVPEADLVSPGLSSVSTDPHGVGERAARLLLRRIAEPDTPAEAVIAPTSIVERPSIGPAASLTTSGRRD